MLCIRPSQYIDLKTESVYPLTSISPFPPLNYCIFNFEMVRFLFFLVFYFFAKTFYVPICFKRIHPYFLEHFYNSSFKICQNYLLCWYWYLLSFAVWAEIFLILNVPCSFGLYPGHFKYHVINFWVLYKAYDKCWYFSLIGS